MSADQLAYWSGFDICQPRRICKHDFDGDSIVPLFFEASRDDLRSFDLRTRWAMAHSAPWGCER